MQKTAKEVTHFVTSHNQKQQQKQCIRQTQAAANRPREVVHCKPKTTTNKQKKQHCSPTNAENYRRSIRTGTFHIIYRNYLKGGYSLRRALAAMPNSKSLNLMP
jgi:hypothetical protein